MQTSPICDSGKEESSSWPAFDWQEMKVRQGRAGILQVMGIKSAFNGPWHGRLRFN